MSRYEISQESEVSEAVLSRFVNGERGITLETAAKVATVLGLSLADAGTAKSKRRKKAWRRVPTVAQIGVYRTFPL